MHESIVQNSSLALLGHNGAGKSTLIRFLLGYYKDRSQHVFLERWRSVEPIDRSQLGYVPELPYLDNSLTGHETLQFLSQLKKTPYNKSEGEILVQRTGLNPEDLNKKVSQYSKGMKQRLLLSQALINQPKVLVLDEPLSGLDPFGHQQIRSLLLEIKQHTCIIVSTHSLEDAYLLGDRIWLLKEGDFIYQGEKPNSLEELKTLYFKHPPDFN